jgi:hypothetical protein
MIPPIRAKVKPLRLGSHKDVNVRFQGAKPTCVQTWRMSANDPEQASDAFFGLRFPRELSEGRLRHAKGLSQDDLAYEAEVIFRGMAHGADNVSNREPLQVGKRSVQHT